ncbi:MAG TPA: RNA methyltransferase [Acidobacteriaceae bacterium]|jgi:tRNA/rRNA methyltransferase|nr:RNA methyltransferase [Acidobacteriaceae bacterium]
MGLTAEERDRLRVVLVRTRNPLNIGAVARAMVNFGFNHLRVVEPYEKAFREARSAVDAEPVLKAAEEFRQIADAVADCALVVGTAEGRQRKPEEPLQRLEAGVEEIRRQLRSGARVAVLFGSEKRGLSNQELSYCRRVLRIPTEGEQPSMNLGQAVAVLLYEAIRQEEAQAEPAMEIPPATTGDRERLVGLLAEALKLSDAARKGERALGEEKMRRLVRHMALTEPDAREWMGMVRQVVWKLRGGEERETPRPEDGSPSE